MLMSARYLFCRPITSPAYFATLVSQVAFSSLAFAALVPAAYSLQGGGMSPPGYRVGVRMQQAPPPTNSLRGPGDNSLDPAAGNFRKLSDKLKEADVERRLEQEAIDARENAAKLAREARERKIALMRDIPDAQKAGTVDDYMFKEGVKEILDKLDYDLIGLKPVKTRVREIASLLVVDKMRLKLGLETSRPGASHGLHWRPWHW